MKDVLHYKGCAITRFFRQLGERAADPPLVAPPRSELVVEEAWEEKQKNHTLQVPSKGDDSIVYLDQRWTRRRDTFKGGFSCSREINPRALKNQARSEDRLPLEIKVGKV